MADSSSLVQLHSQPASNNFFFLIILNYYFSKACPPCNVAPVQVQGLCPDTTDDEADTGYTNAHSPAILAFWVSLIFFLSSCFLRWKSLLEIRFLSILF